MKKMLDTMIVISVELAIFRSPNVHIIFYDTVYAKFSILSKLTMTTVFLKSLVASKIFKKLSSFELKKRSVCFEIGKNQIMGALTSFLLELEIIRKVSICSLFKC